MKYSQYLSLCLLLLFATLRMYGQNSVKFHADFVTISPLKELVQEIYYSADTSGRIELDIYCYKYKNEKDSSLIYWKMEESVPIEKGAHRLKQELTGDDSGSFCDRDFYTIIKKTALIPAGNYKIFIKATLNGRVFNKTVLRKVDSIIGSNSTVNRQIEGSMKQQKKRKFLGVEIQSSAKSASLPTGHLEKYQKKINKTLKAKGLRPVYNTSEDKNTVDLYYNDWYVGTYEGAKRKSILKSRLKNKQENGTESFNKVAKNELENYETIFSQLKKYNKQKRDDREIEGEVSLSVNTSNGQEENSGVNNNYFELGALLSVPIAGVPFTIQGMYTSQDANRKIKSSFIRMSYDAVKAKEELQNSVSGFNSKFSETQAKGASIDMVYGQFLQRLKGEREGLLRQLQKDMKPDAGAPEIKLSDEELKKRLAAKAEGWDKNKPDTKSLEEKRKKLEDIEAKIDKYERLISQYRDTKFFDSALAYDKLKDIGDVTDISYKKLSKKASQILPDDKTRGFKTGLTNLELGMLQKTLSKYTLDGQTLMGGDIGYDFGLFESGLTIGNVEYISRTGEVEKYTGYAIRNTFVPYRDQKVTVLYYGYMPARSMIQDSFFKKVDIAAPVFRQPNHVLSINYKGKVSDYITANAEMATSFRKFDTQNLGRQLSNERLAYIIAAEGNIPKTSIMLNAEYESIGKEFENNTLAVLMNGMNRITLGGKSSFFRSFITAGIEYNHLLQRHLASVGRNTKWGFEIKTNSKRYPSVSISYKPFSTVRSLNDTLNIPQRPSIGEVWAAKSTYQVKRIGYSLRFQLMYTRSSTTMDSIKSGSELLQLNNCYDAGRFTTILTGGMTSVLGNINVAAVHRNVKFAGVNVGYQLLPELMINAGQEVGFSQTGLTRYSASTGAAYRLKNVPLSFRYGFRYNTYTLGDGSAWKYLLTGSLDIVYQFKASLLRKNQF